MFLRTPSVPHCVPFPTLLPSCRSPPFADPQGTSRHIPTQTGIYRNTYRWALASPPVPGELIFCYSINPLRKFTLTILSSPRTVALRPSVGSCAFDCPNNRRAEGGAGFAGRGRRGGDLFVSYPPWEVIRGSCPPPKLSGGPSLTEIVRPKKTPTTEVTSSPPIWVSARNSKWPYLPRGGEGLAGLHRNSKVPGLEGGKWPLSLSSLALVWSSCYGVEIIHQGTVRHIILIYL